MNIYISKKILKYIVISFVLALFITFLPWDEMNPRGFFIDREQYFFSYEYKSDRLNSFEAEFFYNYIFNEWLWHFLTGFSRNYLDISPHIFFGFVTFLAFFTYCSFILIKSEKFYYIFYLLHPDFINFIYSQLRLAFAMSLFIISIYFLQKRKFILFSAILCITLMIHTSMILFWSMLFFSIYLSKRNISNYLKIFFIFLFGFFLAVLIGPLRSSILSYFGDRRVDYGDFSSPVIYLLIYVIYYFSVLFFSKNKSIYKDYIHIYSFIIFSFLFFTLLIGGYASRFVFATYFFIVISLFLLKKDLGNFFHIGYIFYLIFTWFIFLT